MKDFKKKKHLKSILNECFEISETPTNTVILKNAGLVNGFTCTDIYSLVNNHNQVKLSEKDVYPNVYNNELVKSDDKIKAPKEIFMFETKSYSVVLFESENDSTSFVECFDGFVAPDDVDRSSNNSREARRVLYCFYVENLDEWLSKRANFNAGNQKILIFFCVGHSRF